MSKETPFVWHEINTPDATAAKEFYARCFGWETSEMDMGGDGKYTMFNKPGEEPFGGIVEMKGDQLKDIPAHWAVYIGVEDIQEMVKNVQLAGGKVIVPPFEKPDVGWTSLIQDPQGASFYLYQSVSK